MRVPKTLGARIDKLFEMRTARLAAQKAVDAMREEEGVLSGLVLDHLAAERSEKASGKLATASRVMKTVGKVHDWPKFQKYVAEHDAFDLLQRRVNDAAYRDRLELGERVAGIDPENVLTLSLTASKKG